MESTENDRTVFRPSHKTLKIEKTDFHIPTATTTTEQSFHLKTRKTGPDNRSHLTAYSTEFKLCAHSATLRLATLVDTLRAKGIFPTMEMRGLLMRRWCEIMPAFPATP
jgi:hypothetical protein